jgi:dTDP-4-dehydrorhamnose 3,5-epimerase
MTLEAASEVLYLMTDVHQPALAGGVRWDDPAFDIRWPLAAPAMIADRDRDYPDFRPDEFTVFRDY